MTRKEKILERNMRKIHDFRSARYGSLRRAETARVAAGKSLAYRILTVLRFLVSVAVLVLLSATSTTQNILLLILCVIILIVFQVVRWNIRLRVVRSLSSSEIDAVNLIIDTRISLLSPDLKN